MVHSPRPLAVCTKSRGEFHSTRQGVRGSGRKAIGAPHADGNDGSLYKAQMSGWLHRWFRDGATVYWPGSGMFALLGSRETGGMSNSKKTTVKWFRRSEFREAVGDGIQSGRTSGADGRTASGSDASGSAFRSRAVRAQGSGAASSRPPSVRSVAASLACLIGLSAAAWGSAASAQADEVAPSSASVSSRSLASVHGASVLTLDLPTPSPSGQSAKQAGKSSAAQKRDLKATIQELVDVGYPGALAAKADKDGNAVGATAGKGNLATGEAPPLDGEVRIASNTKTFVAVLIMKMVEEGKVKLDEPIETYLPGLIKGQGVDGKKITVRQLLQHTSGLPDFGDGQLDYFAIRNDYVSPRDVLDGVLSRPAQFAPGAKFQYNNANYVALGLLAERVAKRPIAEQIETKIVKPLGLKHTYMPAPGEKTIRGKHPHGYHTRDGKPGKLEDITEADPSWEWAAGSMISTPSELNKFMQSVFDGSLLSQASISEMKKSVPAPEMGGEYGLGLIGYKSSCGVVWGHSGNNPGFHSLSAVRSDGTAATIVVTSMPSVNAKEVEMIKAGKYEQAVSALDKTLCGK